jgi:hypothetical protein
MAQSCRVEFRHTDIQASDEIDSFILFMADGVTLTVLYTDCGFEEIGEEFAEAGFVLCGRADDSGVGPPLP